MPTRRHVKVFIASPGDVLAEREITIRVIERLNREISDALDVTLEALRYETHSVPGMARPESLITPLVGKCDVFIGILWHRFGSSPGPTPDGTFFGSSPESVSERKGFWITGLGSQVATGRLEAVPWALEPWLPALLPDDELGSARDGHTGPPRRATGASLIA